MYCRRSAVDDDRSRKTRLAVDDDRRQGRWAVDDARSRIAFYQAQSKESLDRVDRNLDLIRENLRAIRKMRKTPATIPRYSPSSSSISSFASRRQRPSRHDYPPLELPLRWREPPPLKPTKPRSAPFVRPMSSGEVVPNFIADPFHHVEHVQQLVGTRQVSAPATSAGVQDLANPADLSIITGPDAANLETPTAADQAPKTPAGDQVPATPAADSSAQRERDFSPDPKSFETIRHSNKARLDQFATGILDGELPDSVDILIHAPKPPNSSSFGRFMLSHGLSEPPNSNDPIISLNSHGLFEFEQLWEKKEGEDWEERFRGHTDTKPHDPQSVSFDVSFHGAEFVYGIAEHASTSLALRATRGPGVEHSESYRLFNLDVFEYLLDSPFRLYGSIPFMLSHGLKGSARFFLAQCR
ncbi:hypothetical protein KFK09_005212 [Dendrobium nobile]|uniref:Glycoside hydrolase family 31 N-terminal domain-containing protein n=1 Tax=Dendrobium nobile TaxID=94219 RepID=A0A8T3BV88_DENNO|nr:hypothetical protein KFK09_005212 [Dendrobium nobile]